MEKKKCFFTGLGLLVIFIVWTVLVRLVDVQPIGPQNSSVGFATLNGYFHSVTGVNIPLYIITDWLGLVPFVCVFGFAVLGLIQWITRKSLRKVDGNILMLGGFYVVLLFVYVLFELVIINYRPILIDGYLEASYPSSTTLLVLCVMPTTMIQLCTRIKHKTCKSILLLILSAFTAFMLIGRLVSGVHWLTDIIGGALFSTGIVLLYYSIIDIAKKKQ